MSELSREIWKPVIWNGISLAGLYAVSNLGRIAKYSDGGVNLLCEKKPITNRRGIVLWKNRQKIYSGNLSRVIAAVFIRQPKKGEVVDHINNNPFDDRLCNLQIISHSENVKKDHHFNAKNHKFR